ncbi:uncharacterized protein Pyn_15913 [Prunus yedoensis var. nudiflora]|uniref:Uncharacterized protein n=1 Tax=Prunus yedoensis var. nudiflora TaxID=2094558 RepID=A0A314ZQ07_PRUYE|nr:uncharacterized protein Pyn_15913 [Prunus yedoensis var. nudiflora]
MFGYAHFVPTSPRVWSRIEIVENVLWLASAAFIVYYGDRKSNLIYLFWHDDRIRSLGQLGNDTRNTHGRLVVLLRFVANMEFLDPSSSGNNMMCCVQIMPPRN